MTKRHWCCKFLVLLTGIIICVTGICEFSVKKVKGVEEVPVNKRGYILDRNFTPIALTSTNYKAYYLLSNSPIPKEIKKYIGNILNLPTKGFVLLSEDLSPEEVKKLSRFKKVIIEKQFKRKLLHPELKFLIGETFNGAGISGVERIFDSTLRKGEAVVLSISIPVEKELELLSKIFKGWQFAAAVFNLDTGEVLGYFENSRPYIFNEFFPTKWFGLSKKDISDFKWELSDKNLLSSGTCEEKVTLWYLAKFYMDHICNKKLSPTLLLKQNAAECKVNIEGYQREFKIPKGVVEVLIKGHKMLIIALKNRGDSQLLLSEGLKTRLRRVISALL